MKLADEERSWLIIAACEYLLEKPNHDYGFCYWAKYWKLSEGAVS